MVAYAAGKKDTSFTIPDSVTIIGKEAFRLCYLGPDDSLMNIVIPDSVTIIEDEAFSDCIEIKSITFTGTTQQWNEIEFGGNWMYDVPVFEIICSDGVVSL